MNEQEEEVRLQGFFVDSMSGPALQILGTRFNIEPFFFSSALNRIPSWYQEQARGAEGDHITISLPFIRAIEITHAIENMNQVEPTEINVHGDLVLRPRWRNPIVNTAGTNSKTTTPSKLVTDLLAIHMIRAPKNSTLITYHDPRDTERVTSAKTLHDRVYYAGASVYWNNLYAQATDPTFVLVATMWYPLYAWDRALEVLYDHICFLASCLLVFKHKFTHSFSRN